MKKYANAVMLALVGLALALPATTNAAVITFTTNTTVGATGFNGLTNQFQTEAGYNIEWFWGLNNSHAHLQTVGGSIVEGNHNNNSSTLDLTQAQGWRITKVGGGAFSLASIDLAGQIAIGADGALNSAAAVNASAMSLLSNGSAGGSLSTLSTIPSGFSNITELFFTDAYVVNAAGGVGGWTGIKGGNYVDNIVLDAVPEPATMGLMGILSLGTWFIRRRFHV
jgi:hypothetical protein